MLTDARVNEIISPKFCRVETDYGVGTGYICDDDNGYVMTSFHLVGGVFPHNTIYQFSDISMAEMGLLYHCGLVNQQGYIQTTASELKSADDIVFPESDSIRDATITIQLDNYFLDELVDKYEGDYDNLQSHVFTLLEQIKAAIQQGSVLNITLDNKLLWVLAALGCVSIDGNKITITALGRSTTDKEAILLDTLDGRTISYSVSSSAITALKGKNNDELKEKLFGFLKKGLETAGRAGPHLFPNTEIRVFYKNEALLGEVIYRKNVSQELQLNNYALLDTLPIQLTTFMDGTPYSKDTKHFVTSDKIAPLPDDLDLEVGETVYFGGYPLSQQRYTFSKGMVSAIREESGRSVLVIEGPIAPGNSGSPVFVQRDDKIFRVGTVNSEVANVSQKLYTISHILNNSPESLRAGGIGMVDTFRELTKTIMSNMCTGKGKAIRSSFHSLLSPVDSKYLESLPLEFLVPKKPTAQIPKKLHEYIRAERLRQLSYEDMMAFIKANADKHTRKLIYRSVSPAPNYVINLPVSSSNRDVPAGRIKGSITHVRGEKDESQKADLLALYKFCLQVSNKSLSGSLYMYTDEDVSVHPKMLLTSKFCRDHVSGETQKETTKNAENVHANRSSSVRVSTILSAKQASGLHGEVEKLQDFYALALQHIKTLPADKVVVGLFFQTMNDYRLNESENTSSGNTQTSSRSPFFYSIAEKGDQHFVHHFESTAPKEDWIAVDNQAMEGDIKGPSVYYSLK